MKPHRRLRSGCAALLAVSLAGLVGCGSSSHAPSSATTVPSASRTGVVAFDVHRHLSADDASALDALSSSETVRPVHAGFTMAPGPTHPVALTAPATKAAYAAQMRAAAGAAERYASARAAAADGYVLASYFIPEFGAHWVKWSLVKKPFDPAHPAMLLYDSDGPDAKLAALSYYTYSPNDVAPAGFAGGNDRWHRHSGDCYAGGFLISGSVASSDLCAKIGEARAGGFVHAPVGTPEETVDINRYLTAHPGPAPRPTFESDLVSGNDLWMLHLWDVPGHPNPWGLFATGNPKLTICRGACRSATS